MHTTYIKVDKGQGMQMLAFTCLWIRYSIYVYHLVGSPLENRSGHSVEGQRSKKAMKSVSHKTAVNGTSLPPLSSDTGQHCHERAKARPFWHQKSRT